MLLRRSAASARFTNNRAARRFQFRNDLKDVEDFKEEVKTEMLHSVLFASDAVIKTMAEFVKSPSYTSYIKTVSAMRKDLWGKGTKVEEDILNEFAAIEGNHS